MARVHSEKRMIANGNFYQVINVYYSCMTIIASILACFLEDDMAKSFSLVTIFISISLLAAILQLNPQHYFDLARLYKENYLTLHNLECQAKYIKERAKLQEIEQKYIASLGKCENHSELDYYSALHDAEYGKYVASWHKVKDMYYLLKIWSYLVKVFWIVLPLVIYCFIWIFR